MNPSRNIFRKLKDPLWVGVAILILGIIVIILSSRALYLHTALLFKEELRGRILAISISTAAGINAQDVQALQVQSDWKKPQWSKVVGKLHSAKYGNKDIVFMYIFRKTVGDPNQMEFVADADSLDPFAQVDVNRDGVIEPDGPDKLQWPGQPYPEAADIPEAFAAYDGPIVTSDLYTDVYGSVLTGYAPIKDVEGNVVAVLGTDVKADDFLATATRTLEPFIAFIAFLATVISGLMIGLIWMWRKYGQSLERFNAERSELISIVTHHIGSPLTVLKIDLSHIKEMNDPAALEVCMRRELFDVLDVSTENLIHVMRDFMDVCEIDDGKVMYDFQEISLRSVLADADIPDAVILADSEKLAWAFGAIFANSAKYAGIGNVRTTAEIKETSILIRIADSGVRNLPTTPKRLLHKFSESNNQIEADIIGKDLSLYIVKKIVEAHRGHFAIRREGEETVFSIELPLC